MYAPMLFRVAKHLKWEGRGRCVFGDGRNFLGKRGDGKFFKNAKYVFIILFYYHFIYLYF